MFYSQCLLWKKGALRTIWVAAHCFKRLKKDQVSQTNISSSVDKILLDEVPIVTHRVLAFLLLGVVKIYSRKVDYLYDDCHRVVNRINDFAGIKKKAGKLIEGMRAPRVSLSIIRPKALELDAFDLQILDDQNGGNVRAAEDVTLEDARTTEDAKYQSPERNHYEADIPHPEPCSTAHTPVKDVISPFPMEKDIGTSSRNLVYSEPSIENLRLNGFSLDDRLDPMVLGDTDGDRDLFGPMFDKSETDGKQTKLTDKEDEGYSDEMNVLVNKAPESGKRQDNIKDRQVSMNVDVTFQSKDPHDSGNTPPELIGVRTPVIKEHGSSSRKRKCLFDDAVVLSNKLVKDNLKDTSSLVCKRHKAPLTALQAWKRHQISNLPCTFFEPLFPYISSELRSLFCGTKMKTVEDVGNMEAAENLNMPESSTRHVSPDEAHVAPTPVIHSASLRSYDNGETVEFDRGQPSSTFERIDAELYLSEEEDPKKSLTNEGLNSQGEVNQERDGWSDRTRLVARQLCRSFLSRKKQGQTKGISLSQILKKKMRRESARFFYETLVLKTRGYLDMEQNEAYGDILVLETPKLKQACESGEFGTS